MLTDTHVHFDGMIAAGAALDAIMARAEQAGVSRMIAVGGSPAANRTALEIARAYPARVRAAVGYDRGQATDDGRRTTDDRPEKTDTEEDDGRQPACNAMLSTAGRTMNQALTKSYALARARPDKKDGRTEQTAESEEKSQHRTSNIEHPTSKGRSQTMDELEAMLAAPEAAAIGEIGLDFHHGRGTALAQIELFRRMLLLARERRLPVCVHTRSAETETLAALRAHAGAWRGAPDRIGVMHCFTGGEAFARDLLALGFSISFSGIVTFKKAGSLPAVAALTPDDRLLIETDSPYLAPEPFRGQPNEPARVRRVAEVLAEIRHTSWEAIAELTARNAAKMFF